MNHIPCDIKIKQHESELSEARQKLAETKQRAETFDRACTKALNERDEAHQEIERLQDELQDWQDTQKAVMSENCPSDEKHCTCVPMLRREIERLKYNLKIAEAVLAPCTNSGEFYSNECDRLRAQLLTAHLNERELRVVLEKAQKTLIYIRQFVEVREPYGTEVLEIVREISRIDDAISRTPQTEVVEGLIKVYECAKSFADAGADEDVECILSLRRALLEYEEAMGRRT